MPDYDAIVIGSGNNGLAAATLLAKQGLGVLVLEKNRYVGGMAATVELFPGYRFEVAASVLFPLAREIVEDLELEKHGLDKIEADIGSVMLGQPGDPPVIFYNDPIRMAQHLATDHGPEAAQGMMGVFAFCAPAANAINRFTPLTPPRSAEEIFASAASPQEREALEVCLKGSAMDVINRFFPNPDAHRVLRGFLGFMAVQSTYKSPYSPGSAICLAYAMSTNGDDYMRKLKGGMGALPEGLCRSFQEKGGEVRLMSRVGHVLLENGKAIGVELAGGEQITAGVVLSNLDVNTTLQGLVGEEHLPSDLVDKLKRVDHRAAYVQLQLGLDELPEYTGEWSFLNEGELRCSNGIFNTPEEMERNWHECQAGRVPLNPPLGMQIPTIRDPELAPEGKHGATIFAFYYPCTAPRDQLGRLKDEMSERVIDKVTRYAPNFRDAINNQANFASIHYERMFGCAGGDFTHGLIHPEQMLDQRPMPGWKGYATPLENLFICGSSCHPGPGVTFIPGYNCAHEVLEHLGRRRS
jgi:phytoene dehydrogenase-like protein